MIKEATVREILEKKFRDTDFFLVDVKVKPGNKIVVFADTFKGISVDECAKISRFIESELDRDKDDYELEVSSPGITQVFKVNSQYKKNIGKQIQILLKDGTRKTGTLINSNEEGIKLGEKAKGKKDGLQSYIHFNEIKETRLKITF